jgi:hypothetical protein
MDVRGLVEPIASDDMTEPHMFLRFAGLLWEDMTFEREAGWETERIADRPKEGSGEYSLELLDADGRALVEVRPPVDFDRATTYPQSGIRNTRVVAYIPFDTGGRELVFRRGDRVIDRREVAAEPPGIRITELKRDDKDRVRIRWQAEQRSQNRLTYRVVYLVDDKRAFSLASGLEKTDFEADLSGLPGSKVGRLSVLATDGVRSAFAVSEPFPVSDKDPRISIQSPQPRQLLQADQPVSLNGQATDVAGASLAHDDLIWLVDGETVAKGTPLAIATGLEPGKHVVTLQYRPGKRVLAEESVEFEVAKRSPEQEAFRKLTAAG